MVIHKKAYFTGCSTEKKTTTISWKMFTYTHYTIYNKWSLDIKTAVIGWFCWICIQTQISVTLIVLLEFNIQWLLNEWCSPWAPTRIYFLTHKGLWSRTAPKLLHPPPPHLSMISTICCCIYGLYTCQYYTLVITII